MNDKQPAAPAVLVVDDQRDMAEMVVDGLNERGYRAWAVCDPQAAHAAVDRGEHDALVTDIRMPVHDGFDLLALSQRRVPEAPVVMMTAFSGIDSAIESIRRGAYHYLTKPFRVEELTLFLERGLAAARTRRETLTLKRQLRSAYSLRHFIGQTRAMREIADVVERIADTTASVLVLGETGVGKGVVARALHAESRRADRPFVALNCAALPENLLESELFGHTKGAFTGAASAHDGLFVQADGGTLFLDEIAEMSPALQAKLLQVLESGVVRPLGSTRERPVDVRIVAATHRSLAERVAGGAFREDLLYRLDVVTIEVPALRFRRDDIPLLAEHFFREACAKYPRTGARRIGAEAMQALCQGRWPGNVRELKHALERAVLLANAEELEPSTFARALSSTSGDDDRLDFGHHVRSLRELQIRYVQWALERNDGHKSATREALGIDHKTLNRWLELGRQQEPER